MNTAPVGTASHRLESDMWLSPKEAAFYAGCHIQSIQKACRLRELVHSRRGQFGHIRIRRSDVDRWIRRNEVPVSRAARA